jgi:DNA-binding transcriptional LysR family regulator
MTIPLNNRSQSIVNLPSLVAFEAVARHLNFTRAAAELLVSPTAISKTIKQLEQQIGTRLFNRTTRSVQLTESGLQLVESLTPALEQIRDSVQHIADRSGQPSGVLRINTAHVAFAMLIEPHLQDFLLLHPEITLEISVDSSFSDIVKSGFDAGVRLGHLLQCDMVAVPLGSPQQNLVVGTPEYFERCGTPKTPQDLLAHNCIRLRLPDRSTFLAWRFRTGGKDTSIEVHGNLIVDEMRSIKAAVLKGNALAFVLRQFVAEQLADGLLCAALEDFAPVREAFYIYYPSRVQLPGKLRAFIDFFQKVNQ